MKKKLNDICLNMYRKSKNSDIYMLKAEIILNKKEITQNLELEYIFKESGIRKLIYSDKSIEKRKIGYSVSGKEFFFSYINFILIC